MESTKEADRYIMEGNKDELDRLKNQHDTIRSGMGTLTIAPVDFVGSSLRILDSGTADGLWLRELQASIQGSHEYWGTDIVPSYFPANKLPGIHFQVQSITQDWPTEWFNYFDYVHQRLTLPGAGQTPLAECVKNLLQLVKPGGWIELVEADFSEQSKNGPFAQQFEGMMVKMLGLVGVGHDYATHLHQYMTQSGLKDVETRNFDIPYGAACADTEVAEKSASHILSTARGLSMFFQSQNLETTGTDKGDGDFEKHLEEELKTRGAFFRMRVVWARKPVLP